MVYHREYYQNIQIVNSFVCISKIKWVDDSTNLIKLSIVPNKLRFLRNQEQTIWGCKH